MPPSTREFVSADLAAADAVPAADARRATLGSAIGRPAGAIGAAILIAATAAGIVSPVLMRSDPFALAGPPLSPPSRLHLMGTDGLGRDLFSGVMHGAGASLLIAACVGVLALLCGLSIGLAAGYDKSGESVATLAALGFGSVEIGSISIDPSDGNPKPRLWRLPEGAKSLPLPCP